MATHRPTELRWAARELAAAAREAGLVPAGAAHEDEHAYEGDLSLDVDVAVAARGFVYDHESVDDSQVRQAA